MFPKLLGLITMAWHWNLFIFFSTNLIFSFSLQLLACSSLHPSKNGKLPPQFHNQIHRRDLSGDDGETNLHRHGETHRSAEQSLNLLPPLRPPPQETQPPLRPLGKPETDDPRRSRDGVGIPGGSAPLHRGQVPGAAEARAPEVQPRRRLRRRGDPADSEGDLAPAQERDVARWEDGEVVWGSGGTWREESRWCFGGDAEDGD